MTKSEKDMEVISGDGLRLTKDRNKKLLEIKGDGCKITIGRNCGMIRVIGDGCRLKVIENFGSIEYKGDGGRVDLGPDSSKDKVTFIGHGSHVKYLNVKPVKSSGEFKELRPKNQQDILSNFKEEKKQNSIFENENQLNERRERCKMNESKFDKGSTMIVTKIIVDANGECRTNVRTFCKNRNSTRC